HPRSQHLANLQRRQMKRRQPWHPGLFCHRLETAAMNHAEHCYLMFAHHRHHQHSLLGQGMLPPALRSRLSMMCCVSYLPSYESSWSSRELIRMYPGTSSAWCTVELYSDGLV